MRSVRVHVRGPRRSVDPTRTATLRKRFMGEAGRRFDTLARRIRQIIVEDDAFGLAGAELAANVIRINRPRQPFDFPTNPAKIAAFMSWLEEAQRDEILTVSAGTPVERAGQRAWTATYIETAYQKGIADAGRKLRGAGVRVEDSWIRGVFNRPIHADRVGIIYTRAYEDLVDITREMDAQISSTLAEGLAEGRGPIDIARRLTNRVAKVGRARAKLLARTEVINTHAESTLNAYEEAHVEGVEVESEFATARDAQVCPECRSLEGRTYTLAEARGVIPVHPNCRCAWLPAIVAGRGIELNRRLRRRAA